MSRLPLLVFVSALMVAGCGSAGSGDSGNDEWMGGSGGGSTTPGGSGGLGGNVGNEPVNAPYVPADDDLQSGANKLAAAEVFAQAGTFCPNVDSTVAPSLTLGLGDPLTMASAGRVRELLNAHRTPVPSTLREGDFVNYFHPRTSTNTPMLEFVLEMRPRVVAGYTIPLQYELYAEVRATSVSPRPDLGLVVLVDTTSTTPPDALEQAKDVLRALGNVVTPADEIKVMTTDSTQPTWLVDTSSAAQSLSSIADGLNAGVGATAADALTRALAEAQSLAHPWRRVLFVSNGSLGTPGDLTVASEYAGYSPPVFVSVASVGDAEAARDDYLGQLAHQGRGAYVHAAAPGEADRLMTKHFGELFGIAYDNVSVQLSLPWFFSVLDESTPPGFAAPQYLAPGSSMRFLLLLKACNVDLLSKLGSSPITLSASSVDVASGAVLDQNASLTVAELQPTNAGKKNLERMLATKAFVAALKAPTAGRLGEAQSLLDPLAQAQDEDAQDMLQLLSMHPVLSP
jgi:hypothetical protein